MGEAFPQVLAASRAGAEWAWQRLYESVAGGVRGYVAAQGARDPDDLTGEVLLQLVRGIQRFEGDEAAFRSWVFVIAHHRVVDERRRASRRQRLDARVTEVEREADGPDGEVLERTWPEEWEQRLAQLSDDQRTVVLLRVVAGLSAEEVGEVLGKKAGAVRVMQHRAIARLREICAPEVTP